MDEELYSLGNLRDVVLPNAPASWPPTAGMWLALCIVALTLLLAILTIRLAQRRNAHRKAGLLLLRDVSTVHDVSVVLKRVALAAFPRQQVASLYGEEWAAFLQQTCPKRTFDRVVASDAAAIPDKDLLELAGTWIQHHRVPRDRTPVMAQ
jgi:hypothetical protein